jgi:hypothetical protein
MNEWMHRDRSRRHPIIIRCYFKNNKTGIWYYYQLSHKKYGRVPRALYSSTVASRILIEEANLNRLLTYAPYFHKTS